MMTPEQIALEAAHLSIDERKRVIGLIVDSLVQTPNPEASGRKYSVLAFEGIGAHARDLHKPIDAQEYINQLRSEWDERP